MPKKSYKKFYSSTSNDGYTSLGIPISQIEQEKEEQEAKVKQEHAAIEKMMEKCFVEASLTTTPFFIISFNYFSKDLKGKYFPCEMGIVKFTINEGVTTKCHSLINPGKLPLGHAFAAKDHSERTHMLQPPPNAIGDTDYAEILETAIEFLIVNSNCGKGDKLPLLVMEDERKMTEDILSQFCNAANVEFERFELLPLTYFFQRLRDTCELYYMFKTEFTFSYAVASRHMDRDVYQYYRGNGCPLHEDEEINIHCALSRATRWAFVILDQTMDVCGVTTKHPGLHYPMNCSFDSAKKVRKENNDNESEEEDYFKDDLDDSVSYEADLTNRFSLLDTNGNDEGAYNYYVKEKKNQGAIRKKF